MYTFFNNIKVSLNYIFEFYEVKFNLIKIVVFRESFSGNYFLGALAPCRQLIGNQLVGASRMPVLPGGILLSEKLYPEQR